MASMISSSAAGAIMLLVVLFGSGEKMSQKECGVLNKSILKTFL
jgi:hypothetical protein